MQQVIDDLLVLLLDHMPLLLQGIGQFLSQGELLVEKGDTLQFFMGLESLPGLEQPVHLPFDMLEQPAAGEQLLPLLPQQWKNR